VERDEDDGLSEDLSSPPSDVESEFDDDAPKKRQRKPAAKPRATKQKSTRAERAQRVDSEDQPEVGDGHNGRAAGQKGAVEASDGELSVLDDQPAPKKQPKRRERSESKTKPLKTTSKPKSKAEVDDPDTAEIKRLQGYLVKCGIRKVWGKELKLYDSSKAKIKHLRDMLADAGMTGRFSIEKANQIKEARELAADIEAVQEGAERWGANADEAGGSGDNDDDQPSARRLIRGSKHYDFLSSDGEETD
jgi:hypothetical protein